MINCLEFALFSRWVIRCLPYSLHGRFCANLTDDDRIAYVSGSHLFWAIYDRNCHNAHAKPPHEGVPPIEVPPALGVSPEQVARWCSYRDDHRF